jgi:cell wall-associated NlpC family hydrolase
MKRWSAAVMLAATVLIAACGPSPAPAPPPPPTSAQAGIAVNYALAQVGKPYCYAGTGPCYDCSGLTMMSWLAAGVTLPHPASSQYASIPHVAMNQLQPGDLVFYADLSHVAIYAGSGMVVEATHTGDFVHYWPMRSTFTIAGRP